MLWWPRTGNVRSAPAGRGRQDCLSIPTTGRLHGAQTGQFASCAAPWGRRNMVVICWHPLHLRYTGRIGRGVQQQNWCSRIGADGCKIGADGPQKQSTGELTGDPVPALCGRTLLKGTRIAIRYSWVVICWHPLQLSCCYMGRIGRGVQQQNWCSSRIGADG